MAHGIALGDILVSTWGYGQINVSFFKVTHVTDKSIKYIKLRKEVKSRSVPYEYVVPVDDVAALGPQKPKRKKVHVGSSGDYIAIESYMIAHKWTGNPVGETMLQYGH